MKKQIAVILCVTILLSALCCGCAKGEKKTNHKLAEELLSDMVNIDKPVSGDEAEKSAEEQRQEVVLRFLEAIFLTDPTAAASCVPEELQTWIYESCMGQGWNGTDVNITLYKNGELGSDQIASCAAEYRDELGYILSADEVWGYGFEYTIEWDDGDTETDGGAYGMLAVLIDGVWYAIPADL